jgi:DNA-binding XRE family transcriptional regulator
MTENLFGNFNSLKESRRGLGMTQKEAAKLIGVPTSTWGAWERRGTMFNKFQLAALDIFFTTYSKGIVYSQEWTAEKAIDLQNRLGMSGAEFARQLGVTRQTVNLWKNKPHYKPGLKPSLELDRLKSLLPEDK